jgi:uncharacterized damage-inducible protein DinB
MTIVDEICEAWQDVRNGLIKEAVLIPADQFGFKPADGSRTVLELLQHIVEAECLITGEVCRSDTNFGRAPIPILVAEYAAHVKDADSKDALLELLRSSIEQSKQRIREFGAEKLEDIMTRFDGKQVPKRAMLSFSIAHEMYHRGQVTVYQRVLGIEPALTKFFKQLAAGG